MINLGVFGGLSTFIHIPIFELAKEIKNFIQKLSQKPDATGSLNYLAR
ncbi:MAG: hypothetical protein RIR12_1768 [Bacteroidota bacterium]|jgi:hypothetical protein